MSKANQKDGMQVLKQMREELSLQAHLFSMEMKREWNELENKWVQIQSDLQPLRNSLSQARAARRESLSQVQRSLRESYQRLRNRLKSS